SFYSASGHTDRLLDTGLVIDGKFLRQYVDNLFARRKHQFIHIGYQLLDIKTGNFIVIPFGQDAPMLNTLDVLRRKSNLYHSGVHVGLRFGDADRLSYTGHPALVVRHSPTVYARRFSPPSP